MVNLYLNTIWKPLNIKGIHKHKMAIMNQLTVPLELILEYPKLL